jgi:protein-S-isoprenylcysteine O-methyltransferase Ste14
MTDLNVKTSRPRTTILPPAPFAVALLGGWWLDRHFLALPVSVGARVPWLGWILVGAALLLFVWTFATLRRHHTTVNPFRGSAALCTDGRFQYSRNPIYLGDWFVLAGAALMMRSAWPLLFAPAIWALIRYGVIRHEEAYLAARFGDTYRVYRSRVRRWL